MTTDVSQLDLPMLLAKKFVARTDVKAVQDSQGAYRPIREPWKKKDFRDHVEGTTTYGHYVCNQDSQVKVIVLDIDLTQTGYWIEEPDMKQAPADPGEAEMWLRDHTVQHQGENPRELWHNRKHPARTFYKTILRTMAEMLSSAMHSQLDLATACAYSGNKGVHVYGFLPELTDAEVARAAGLLAMEYAATTFQNENQFVATRGNNFYQLNNEDVTLGFHNMEVELFPKQSSMDGKDLGNLVRLPLGVNQKNPKDPCFLLDQRAPGNVLAPHPDPRALLLSGNPWAD